MAAVGVTFGGCLGEPAEGRVVEIDRIEDGVVYAVDRESGRALAVKRGVLSPRIREGDVVVDGRADPALAADLRAEVARARAALGPPRRGSFDLDEAPGGQAREPPSPLPRPHTAPPRGGDNPRLTHPREP